MSSTPWENGEEQHTIESQENIGLETATVSPSPHLPIPPSFEEVEIPECVDSSVELWDGAKSEKLNQREPKTKVAKEDDRVPIEVSEEEHHSTSAIADNTTPNLTSVGTRYHCARELSSHTEIAETQGITYDNICKGISLARKQLKERLSKIASLPECLRHTFLVLRKMMKK